MKKVKNILIILGFLVSLFIWIYIMAMIAVDGWMFSYHSPLEWATVIFILVLALASLIIYLACLITNISEAEIKVNVVIDESESSPSDT